MSDTSLILEGGGLRGAFTSGALDCLLDHNLRYSHVIGVSAGACIGATYLAGQRERNHRIYVDLPSDPRFMGWRYYFSQHSYFNMKFLFDEVPNALVPFDEQAFYASTARFTAVTTALSTGAPAYWEKPAIKPLGLNPVLCASSSIPFLSPAVRLGEEWHYDGGVGDSIPVRYALNQHERALVILTRPRGYRKSPPSLSALARLGLWRHPAFAKALVERYVHYNESLDYLEAEEKAGRLLVLSPSSACAAERTEKDPVKLDALYRHGYQSMEALLPRLETSFLP